MAIWTERQRQLIADAEDECEREDAADNKPDDIRDRVLARLQAITDEQIDALIARALEGPPSYLRLVLQLAGVSLKERDVRTPVKGANLIIIEPTQEELDEYAATHQPVRPDPDQAAPPEHPTPQRPTPNAEHPTPNAVPTRPDTGTRPPHAISPEAYTEPRPRRSESAAYPWRPTSSPRTHRKGPEHTTSSQGHRDVVGGSGAARARPRSG